MKPAAQRTTAAIAVVATASISGLIWGAAPAFALPNPCGTGTLISGNICEQTFTSTTASDFTPPATTKLEALLVGGGGGGYVGTPNVQYATNGYATAGGGGQVKIVDFTASQGSSTPLVVTVGAGGGVAQAGGTTSVTGGVSASADGGGGASTTTGGSSGPNTGASISDGAAPLPTYYGGGAGAGAGTSTIDGGAGVAISTTYASDPLFGSDGACYGGGGAATQSPAVGTTTCGGNAPDSDPTATSYQSIVADSGGGGAASLAVGGGEDGSDGVVVFRWIASYTLTFAADGHGVAPATQVLPLGTLPTQPVAPTQAGFVFNGWYTDPGLTTPAEFTVPLTGSTTFYAKWDPILATTGGGPNQDELPIAVGTLTLGVGLFGVALFYRRKRRVV